MSLRRVLAIALRIVRQFLRDRRSLALVFLAPLLIMTLLNFVLNNSTSGVTIGIVSPQSTGSLAAGFREDLSGVSGVTLIDVDRNAVETTLRNSDADGVLIFPAVFSPTSQTIALRLEGSDPAAAQQVRGIVSQLMNAYYTRQIQGGVGGQIGVAVTVSYLYGGPQYTETDALAPIFVGLFAFFFIFLLTSVSFLRERSQGTTERLMVSPLSRAELVLGYVLGFTVFALLQSIIILAFVIYVLRVHYAGNLGLLFLVTLALTVGAVNLGIFVSAFARNELQVIQFIPLLLVPQALLGGLFFPVKTLPVVLKQLAYIMPLTYSNFALKDVMLRGYGFGDIWPDLTFLVGFALLMIVAAAFSLRQERV